ncbi:NU153 protein, partial [Rhinopomastus cyanomelas]|nr:NU153 protein [Rhinopomastus cyanomelas]
GIFSKVTESVKSMVPGWLQKYFHRHANTNESSTQEDSPVNYGHDYCDEDAVTIHGRVTPETRRINLEEPSTSRSVLNSSDVLTRPSLHRSHLNWAMLDSTVPHCQPSTSSLGIGGPGLSLVKEIKDSTSQHDDDNISTTSGFSSRASDKDVTVSKNTSAPLLWSSEQHSAATSKKPAFNVSAFGSPSSSLGSISMFKTSQVGDSPFYPGKTTYGGAAAAPREVKVRPAPYQQPLRRQMKAKNANVRHSYGVTSSTARRILQCLEKMSSPLVDAKKIPFEASPLPPSVDNNILNITSFQSRQKRMASQHPPVQKLMIPKTIPVSGSRSNFFKPSLTPTTDSGKTPWRVDLKRQLTSFLYCSSTMSYPKFSTPASNGLSSGGGGAGRSGGKMKRERGVQCVSKPGRVQQEVEEPELPNIPLPISTSCLPSFNFTFCSSNTVSSPPSTVSTVAMNKVEPASNVGSPVFTFSSPIMKSAKAEVLPSLPQIGFTFSVPVAKSAEPSGSRGTPATCLVNLDTATVNSTRTKKKKEEDHDGITKPAKVLKEGSVLDILKSPGFMSVQAPSSAPAQPVTSTVVYTRPPISSFSASKGTSEEASSVWQTDSGDPGLQNKPTHDKNVTYKAAKVSTVENTKQTSSHPSVASKAAAPTVGTSGFEDKFQAPPNRWECDTCLVQNKAEAKKCVACETPKPGTGTMPILMLPAVTDSAVTATSSSSAAETTVLGFGDKFKKPEGSWDCSVCLLVNKAEDSKCVACQSEKPGSSVPVTSSSVSAFTATSGEFLGSDKFKKLEGSLVENKPEAAKSVACESPKPETKGFDTAAVPTSAAVPTFTFGIQSSTSGSSHVGNAGDFKFGVTGVTVKFGIAPESESSKALTGEFKFPGASGDVKFGVSPSDSKSEGSNKLNDSKNFIFGFPSASTQAPSTFQFGTTSLGQQEKKEPALGTFTFGTSSASSVATNENKTGVGGFTFGTVTEKEKEKDVASPALAFQKPEEKKDETPAAKAEFSFGSVESAPASPFVLGKTEPKQDCVTSATPIAFGKKADSEELKAQPMFPAVTTEQTKEDSPAKPVFNFIFKPAEKESEQAKPSFPFLVPTTTSDEGAAKPPFNFLSSTSSTITQVPVPTTSANSSNVFGSTISSSDPQPVSTPFVFGQASNTVSGSIFGNTADTAASQSFGFSQEKNPATTPSTTGAPHSSFVFSSGASGTNTANSGFTFGATTTTNSTGVTSSFVFGSGSSVPAAGPAFGAGQPPVFGQSQVSNQPRAPSFGSLSTPLFPTSTRPAPPAFGTVTDNNQSFMFGQQTTLQPGFGSGTSNTAPAPVFQFGSNNSGFNFPNNPGVFTFGANVPATASPAQLSGSSGFPFSQAPGFTVGTNGKNAFSASGSSVSGRKIKTAVRRRK